jgi:hypothetical protein
MFWHRHKWKVTGAQLLYRFYGEERDIRCPITEVLLVCDCAGVKTETLEGHWTLEQLQPASGKAEADKEYFRKMGVKL